MHVSTRSLMVPRQQLLHVNPECLFFEDTTVSFSGITNMRPPKKTPHSPPLTKCEYCGRASQPPDAINCCGCGAPLQGVHYKAIDVTTVGDQYPTFLYVPWEKSFL